MMSDGRYQSDIPANAEERIAPMCDGSPGKQVEYLIDGKLVGTRCWDEDGYLTLETPYKNGLVHGVKYTWYFDGVLTSAEPYFEGKPHGIAKQWSASGELMGTYEMVHGTGIDLWWNSFDCSDEPPFILTEAHYMLEGRLHGFTWWINDDQASVLVERHFRHGVPHGIEREWNENGRLCRGYPRYYVGGERLDKRRYLRAAGADSTLPPFLVEENEPLRIFPTEIRKLLYVPSL
jgi:hypothetical protein